MSTMLVEPTPFASEFNLTNSSFNTAVTFTICVSNDFGEEVLALNIVPPSPTLNPMTVNDELGSRMEALSLSPETTAPFSRERTGGGYGTVY
jgi:hypothetical protein